MVWIDDEKMPATCQQQGRQYQECSVCGEPGDERFTEFGEHQYEYEHPRAEIQGDMEMLMCTKYCTVDGCQERVSSGPFPVDRDQTTVPSCPYCGGSLPQ